MAQLKLHSCESNTAMSELYAELARISLAVSLNPLPVIAVFLTLQSDNPRRLSLAFWLGWLTGISAMTLLLVSAASSGLPEQDAQEASLTLSLVHFGVGALLIGLGIKTWLKRPAADAEPTLPGWMTSITKMTTIKGLGLGLAISFLNIKHLFIISTAAVAISAVEMSTGERILLMIFFAIAATITTTVPTIAALIGGESFTRRTSGFYDWLVENNSIIITLVLVIVGAAIFTDGIKWI